MLDKILLGVGGILGVIIFFQNMIMPQNAYILSYYSDTATLIPLCILFGIMIGFGFKGIISGKNEDDDNF